MQKKLMRRKKRQLPHDSFFKAAMELPEVATEFLQMHLPKNVLQIIDVKTAAAQKDSFVEKTLRKKLTDVLFRCKTSKGQDSFVYVLCEHQSSPDNWMSYRLFKYMFAIWDKYLSKNPDAKTLPLVYPLVFYNGTENYNTYRSLHELCEHPELAKQVLYQDFHLVDASKIPDDELKNDHSLANLMQFFMKYAHVRDLIGLLQDTGSVLAKIYKTPAGYDLMYMILWYNIIKVGEQDQEKLGQVLSQITDKKTYEVTMGSLAEKWENQGIEKGIEKGIHKGAYQEKQGIAINLLKMGIPVADIAKATGISLEEVKILKGKVLR
jgi:predicted transposase/invertase (TIGR01784 family)